MAEIAQVFPDLLDRQKTLGLGGVGRPYSKEEEETRLADMLRAFSMDGVYVTKGAAPLAYSDQTPEEIVKSWEKMAQEWVYLYGGMGNGMTLWFNIWRFLMLHGVRLNEVKVRHLGEALKSSDRPRIFFDYRSEHDPFSGLRNILELKGIKASQEEFEEMTIHHIIHEVGGAPTRWRTMVTLPSGDEPILPPTTSSPFPGAQYGHGFIFIDLEPVHVDGQIGKKMANTTGARSADSVALGNLLVRLSHDPKTAIEVYVEDAGRRLEEMEKKAREKGVEPKSPYTMEEAERYAPFFVETLEPVVEDISQILSQYEETELTAFQYIVIVTSDRMLGTAVYVPSRARPYAWVKTRAKGWELAV